ncbi:hypothetical protein TVAG_302130 [Trichomonas vaginalis G3]|uniref:Uncharacterized protein n=1 Tax=Trichomonas vaginalis (strain ATCC PRA-98 / G3) TaxID=412133 RepID=A2EGN8_TRIV3|nr:pre-mRNA 3'-splice site binding [Trichomonas vaginalis G3]EAY08126.1 hypothetical protein TVAG_302130 [Trichomonas vaginalis G3]KAI5548743.1 pre-mRNA 3'-splice site binding [Trichomonas vaginalis G3]|eukprot:XP_001320349.1 hypothetical protein [Trichomonas vaginalis G3]
MHGEICSRMHIKPQVSNTLLLANFYQNPYHFMSLLPPDTLIIENETIRNNFDEFYLDVYEELRTFGPISEFVVSGNLCEHLLGNVLVMYENLENALTAYNNLRGRYYGGRPIDVQFSPVVNFNVAVCRQFKEGKCPHNEKCNFIHPIIPSDNILELCPVSHVMGHSSLSLEDLQPIQNTNTRSRDRDRDRDRERDRDRDNYRERDRNRYRDFERENERDPYQRNRNYNYDRNPRYSDQVPPRRYQENVIRDYPPPESTAYRPDLLLPGQGIYEYPQPDEYQPNRRRYPSPEQAAPPPYYNRYNPDRGYDRNPDRNDYYRNPNRNYNDRGYNRGPRRDSY